MHLLPRPSYYTGGLLETHVIARALLGNDTLTHIPLHSCKSDALSTYQARCSILAAGTTSTLGR
jgi:hypothetical protein